MAFDPEKYHRRSVRLPGFDYAQAGAYFVTICTQERACLFGAAVDGQIRLNDAGRMVQATWEGLPEHYPGVDVDAFVVMPNHVHGIIVLVGAAPCGRPAPRGRPVMTESGPPVGAAPRVGQPRGVVGHPRGVVGQPQGVAPTSSGEPSGGAPTLSLPDVVHRFKTMTTKRYADGVRQHGWPRFRVRVWQRNYYEHIIRDEESLHRIRQYIADNPGRWTLDPENLPTTLTEGEDA